MKKGDIVIVVVVLLFAGIFLFVLGKQKQGENVHITANGETRTYSLYENRTIELTNGTEVSNVVVIWDGRVEMKSASCPDKICVRHKAVNRNGESIICLPNKVFIEIESKKQKETDN